jgi:hypothetical protein
LPGVETLELDEKASELQLLQQDGLGKLDLKMSDSNSVSEVHLESSPSRLSKETEKLIPSKSDVREEQEGESKVVLLGGAAESSELVKFPQQCSKFELELSELLTENSIFLLHDFDTKLSRFSSFKSSCKIISKSGSVLSEDASS